MVKNGCKGSILPQKHGNWHTIYVKFNLWSKNGTVQKIFEELQNQNIIDVQGEVLGLESSSVNEHPNASGSQ